MNLKKISVILRKYYDSELLTYHLQIKVYPKDGSDMFHENPGYHLYDYTVS
jgi:hypothetical protein